jgi:hypothetical protein
MCIVQEIHNLRMCLLVMRITYLPFWGGVTNYRYVRWMLEQTGLSFLEAGISILPGSLSAEQGLIVCSTARVWKNWECVYTLKGHDRAVWAVLSLGHDEYLTGLFIPMHASVLTISLGRQNNPIMERR